DTFDRDHVDVVHAHPVIRIALFDGVEAERASRVVDEGVYGAEPSEVIAQRVDLELVGEVGDEDVRARLRSESLEPIASAGDTHDLPAVLEEQAHRRRSDSRTRSGDHNPPRLHTHSSVLVHRTARPPSPNVPVCAEPACWRRLERPRSAQTYTLDAHGAPVGCNDDGCGEALEEEA